MTTDMMTEMNKWTQPRLFQPVTDAQWAAVAPLFQDPVKRGRGKPHCSWRTVLNSILFVLHLGGKWGALDKAPEYASKSSAHRWFALWEKTGFLNQILDKLMDYSPLSISLPPRRKRAVSE